MAHLPLHTRLTAVAACAVALPAITLTAVPAAAAGGRPLTTTLTGAAEVPGPGDPDGSGTAVVRVNRGTGVICYEITVTGIEPATAAHIHEAPADEAGPVRVTLQPPADGDSSACMPVDRELARDIAANPDDYYVNVHNGEYPAGAVRGQLG